MIATLARNWWLIALRGLAAVIFGILAFIWPAATVTVLVLLFGAYVLVDGIFSIIAAIRRYGESDRWWVLLLEGLAGVAAGVITFIWPNITALVLLYLIAAWAILTGLLEMIAAVRLRKEIEGEFLLFVAGLLSLVFGLLLVIWPATGILALTWMIGGYAILFGVVLIILAFRLRAWAEDYGRGMGAAG